MWGTLSCLQKRSGIRRVGKHYSVLQVVKGFEGEGDRQERDRGRLLGTDHHRPSLPPLVPPPPSQKLGVKANIHLGGGDGK